MKRRRQQITEEEYQRIRPKLRAKARSLGVSDNDLEDLVQDAFFEAQRALAHGSFEGRSALDTWIVGIVKNLAAQYHRAKKAARRDAPEVSMDASESVVENHLAMGPEVAIDRLLVQPILESLRKLPDKFRRPLTLWANGWKYDEIGKGLGISPGLASSRIHQARDKLRKEHKRPHSAKSPRT